MRIFKFKEVFPQLGQLLFRKRFRFQFEMIPYEVENLPLKKIMNFFIAGLNQYIPRSRPFGYPVFTQVEPANFCNLSCPLCLTVSETAVRTKALLSLNVFQKFIDDLGEYLLLIVLWNWGEPFLNPDIYKMIAYAKARGILIHTSTNGNVDFNENKALEMVDSGLDTIIFGVDGATQETYSLYRVGGDLERVKENIRTIIRVRDQRRASTPRINLRFVVMRHNEHEIPLIETIAKELKVDYLTFKTVDLVPELGADLDNQYAPSIEKFRRYEYDVSTFRRKSRPFKCIRPWKRITLDALGEIISCEYDYKNSHSFGNLNDGLSALDVWKSDAASAFRKHFHFGWNDEYPFCKDCTFKNRVADDCTVAKICLKS